MCGCLAGSRIAVAGEISAHSAIRAGNHDRSSLAEVDTIVEQREEFRRHRGEKCAAEGPVRPIESYGHGDFDAVRPACQDGYADVEAGLRVCRMNFKMLAVRQIRGRPRGIDRRRDDLPAGIEYRHMCATRIGVAMLKPLCKRRLRPVRRDAGLNPLQCVPGVANNLAHLEFECRGEVRSLEFGFVQSRPPLLGNEGHGQNECRQGEDSAKRPNPPFEHPA